MKRSIYRRSSLERLSSPEQLDRLVQITTPLGWLALITFIGLLIAALLWGILGQLPVVVNAEGVLVRPGGVVRVVTLEAGQLRELYVDVGDVVQAGQIVATIDPVEAQSIDAIVSPYAGQVLAVMASKGDFMSQGTAILTLGPPGEQLELVLYVPFVEGEQVQPGMPVQISPLTTKKEEYGFLLGKVHSVANFPSTAEGMRYILGTDELVQLFLANGAPIQIRVSLEADESTASGYAWSSSSGPAFQLTSGTLCSARIIISQQRPISLMLPLLRRKS